MLWEGLEIKNSFCVLCHVAWFCQERTGGKIIYRQAGTVYLFRGKNYNYETRPRFPFMRWKPVSPVYPRLIKRVPEGLTLEKATEMRQKGRDLMPICKLGRLFWTFIITRNEIFCSFFKLTRACLFVVSGKNGVYWDLVTNIREAFEECELVRINCQELNTSDYRRIGAKLKV